MLIRKGGDQLVQSWKQDRIEANKRVNKDPSSPRRHPKQLRNRTVVKSLRKLSLVQEEEMVAHR